MITVHSWPTPDSHKVHIMLEECGLPYAAVPVDIGAGAHDRPAFRAISPAGTVPAIVDTDGPDGEPATVFESGAILLYLAAKAGRLLPRSDRQRYAVLQWLMFQTGSVGPMLGQAHHFRLQAPGPVDYAIERHTNEARRLYAVMDRQLADHAHIAGRHYSIADIAVFPWLRSWEQQGVDWADYPRLNDWFARVGARPAVRRGLAVLADRAQPVSNGPLGATA